MADDMSVVWTEIMFVPVGESVCPVVVVVIHVLESSLTSLS